MAAALLTAAILSFGGLVATTVSGHTTGTADDVWRHVTVGIFSTMIMLLTHSMMMFYFIGKGRAVRDAMKDGGLTGSFEGRISALRRPVFSRATLAMSLTMATAIVGASVDTGVLPPVVHQVLAYASLLANLVTLKTEVAALTGSARVVAEVDRLLNA